MIPSYLPTSKEQALYSIYLYLTQAFIDYTATPPLNSPIVYSVGYQQAFEFPCITIEDTSSPDLGQWAIGDNIGGGFKGKRTQTTVKITIYDQNTDPTETNSTGYQYAEQNVRRLRDIVRQVLSQSGVVDINSKLIMPIIYIADPIVSGLPGLNTGQVIDIQADQPGGWRDTFIANAPEAPNTKKYECYLRIQWIEYSSFPSGIPYGGPVTYSF